MLTVPKQVVVIIQAHFKLFSFNDYFVWFIKSTSIPQFANKDNPTPFISFSLILSTILVCHFYIVLAQQHFPLHSPFILLLGPTNLNPQTISLFIP